VGQECTFVWRCNRRVRQTEIMAFLCLDFVGLLQR